MIAVQLTSIEEVTIAGCADLLADAALRRLERHLRGRSNIVFNLARLEYADTTFLRFLIRLQSRAHSEKQNINIKLIGVGPQLIRLLELAKLSEFFAYEIVPR